MVAPAQSSVDPFAAWRGHFEQVQFQVQQAAEKWRHTIPGGAEGMPAFAAPIAGFLDNYRRSLQGFSGSLEEGQDPLLAGLRHVFAGMHDAVGWGLYTRLGEAMNSLSMAQSAARDAQAQVSVQLMATWELARKRFDAELAAKAERKESFANPQEFLRAWTKVLDAATHEALRSEAGLRVTVEAHRTATRVRAAQNRVVELWSEMFNIPTRAELDEAYRLIHDLRNEVRALRKGRA